jgi:hypothetical protein
MNLFGKEAISEKELRGLHTEIGELIATWAPEGEHGAAVAGMLSTYIEMFSKLTVDWHIEVQPHIDQGNLPWICVIYDKTTNQFQFVPYSTVQTQQPIMQLSASPVFGEDVKINTKSIPLVKLAVFVQPEEYNRGLGRQTLSREAQEISSKAISFFQETFKSTMIEMHREDVFFVALQTAWNLYLEEQAS